jgi:hypothetical protein
MGATFYATIPADYTRGDRAIQRVAPGQAVMFSAASFAGLGTRPAQHRWIPERMVENALPEVGELPSYLVDVAVDSGGFVAAQQGGYRFGWGEYGYWLCLLDTDNPGKLKWAAMPDLPCEAELAVDATAVRARQEETTRNVFQIAMRWRKGIPWAWVPTVQGRAIEEYVWHARYMRRLILDLPYGDWNRFRQGLEHAEFRLGIGSLCKREDLVEAVRVVGAVAEECDRWHVGTIRFHLWGIDSRAIPLLQRAGLMARVASFDTSAFNGRFGRDVPILEAERARLGMTQRSHAAGIQLGRYRRRIEGRLAQQTLAF